MGHKCGKEGTRPLAPKKIVTTWIWKPEVITIEAVKKQGSKEPNETTQIEVSEKPKAMARTGT